MVWLETFKNGPWFIIEFLKYQYRLFTTHDAGQKGFWGYHYVVLLIGCFPASLLAIPSFFRTTYTGRFDKDFKKWMQILFWGSNDFVHHCSIPYYPLFFPGLVSTNLPDSVFSVQMGSETIDL